MNRQAFAGGKGIDWGFQTVSTASTWQKDDQRDSLQL